MQKKHTKELKARMVAGGNQQCGYIDKQDASSPTVTTESVLLSCITDAREGRDVAIIDIPNAFVQTIIEDEKDKFIVQMHGEVVDILCSVSPPNLPTFCHDGQAREQANIGKVSECIIWFYGSQPSVL